MFREKKTFFVNVFLCFFSLEPKISHFCFGSNKKSFWKMWMDSWDRVAVFFRNSFIAPDGLVYSQTNMSPIIWWTPSKVKYFFSAGNRWYQSKAYRDTLRKTRWLKWFNQQDLCFTFWNLSSTSNSAFFPKFANGELN